MDDLSLGQRLVVWSLMAIVISWVVRHVVITWIARRLHILDGSSPRIDPASAPRVTAVIPAKDEEEMLGECLDSVRAQSYPHLDILVVDDRSADATGAIARRHAESDGRVRVLTIDELPEGWTGKTHALAVAAREARGEWLWFLDADTRHDPDCLAIVMHYAREQRAALVSLLPRLRTESFWEGIIQPLAGIVLMRSFPQHRVNDDRSPVAFANGQFLLIERVAYDAIGGHAAVRDRFVEDIYLAKCVKGSGRPIRVAMAGAISSTRMYTSLGQIIRGWSRIFYDALGRRPGPILHKILDPLVFTQSGQLAAVAGPAMLLAGWPGNSFGWWIAGLGWAHQALSLTIMARMYRWNSAPPRRALWYALAGLVMDVVYLRALGMCRSGRVTWRGTTYGPPPSASWPDATTTTTKIPNPPATAPNPATYAGASSP